MRKMESLPISSFLQVGLASILLVLAQGNWRNVSRVDSPKENYFYWGTYANPRAIQHFLGTRLLAADLFWIDLLIKADVKHESDLSPFYRAMDHILDLNPYDFYAAWFGALYLSVVKDDKSGASHLFEKTVERIRNNPNMDPQTRGAIYFAYGYHLMFEEQDLERGSEFVIASSREEGASILARGMAKTLVTESGRFEVGFRVLRDCLKRAKSEAERRIIERKIFNLEQRREAYELNQKWLTYLRVKGVPLEGASNFWLHFLHEIGHNGRSSGGQRLFVSEAGTVVLETDSAALRRNKEEE